jgi:hypothetical protein
MGYNGVDNYLYAADANHLLVSIGANGESQVVRNISSGFDINIRDIDTDGFYWYGDGDGNYGQLDLRPGSPAHGWTVASSATNNLGMAFTDWVYVPLDAEYLYAIAVHPAGGSSMLKFSKWTKQWESVEDYPNVSVSAWGPFYGRVDGTIFATDSGSGDIWSFSIVGLAPVLVTLGPTNCLGNGARCALAD